VLLLRLTGGELARRQGGCPPRKRPNLTVWTKLVVMSYAAGEEPVTEAPQYSLTIKSNCKKGGLGSGSLSLRIVSSAHRSAQRRFRAVFHITTHLQTRE
jgi:hypothetical protein